jgi:catechol 2,3-dioxygenase-like lactoylglutathione lyase family enzyme
MPIEKLTRIHHVAVTVRDGARAAEWYHRVFGFELIQKFTKTWLVGDENCKIGLTELPTGTSVEHLDQRIAIQHTAFHIEKDDFDAAVVMLKSLGVPFEGPEDSGVAGPSVFFHDLDGHELEITAYRPPVESVE